MSLKKLKEEGAALLEEIGAIDETCKAEKRKMNAEEEEKWENLYDKLDAKKSEIRIFEKREKLKDLEDDFIQIKAEEGKLSKDEYRDGFGKAFHKLIVGGRSILTKEDYRFLEENPDTEYRVQVKGTTTAGGFLVPEGFSNMLAEAELFLGPIDDPSLVTVINTPTGNDIPWPKNNDTANVAVQVNENASVASGTDKVFAEDTLKAYKWTTKVVKYSTELAQDSFFNIEQLLANNFAWRMNRGLNAAYTTGAGTTTIEGVVTGSAAGATAAGAAAVTRNDILNLIYSVDKAYRRNGTIMMHDSTAKAIRKLTVGTSDDRPLWTDNIRQGEPSLLEGFPVFINNDMAEIGAANKFMLFGDFKNYVIRKVAGDRMVVLRELYAESDLIGMVMFRRTDGQLIDAGTNPIKYLINAAS
jgi:HK97 family phage major capsid protein